ncbi:MAG: tRNA (guanosine(37)-N1)-methyltransferase TrmD, partial [Opitutus sp.]|nr:tRNA (guanosine(37)-N1)-methyltransferase TrmD [Opitutus sp.]
MRIDVLTLFPAMLDGFLSESMIGRAREAKLLEISVRNVRDWATDKHKTTDDR